MLDAADAARCGGWSGCASARSPAARSVRQHDEIVAAAAADDVSQTAERVRENWLSLGTLIDRSFE